MNTDDYPYLEYFVPTDLFFTSDDNVRELIRHLGDPADLVANLPSDAAAALSTLSEGRKQWMQTRGGATAPR